MLVSHLLDSLSPGLHDEDEGLAEARRRDAELEANPAAGISLEHLDQQIKLHRQDGRCFFAVRLPDIQHWFFIPLPNIPPDSIDESPRAARQVVRGMIVRGIGGGTAALCLRVFY